VLTWPKASSQTLPGDLSPEPEVPQTLGISC
jgi:hypothetical protein